MLLFIDGNLCHQHINGEGSEPIQPLPNFNKLSILKGNRTDWNGNTIVLYIHLLIKINNLKEMNDECQFLNNIILILFNSLVIFCD